MKFIAYAAPGTPESLRVAEAPTPAPAAGEILIEVHYAGVNRPDVMQRQGRYAPPPGASPILGLEVAGHVAALGAEVQQWQVGDAVCALVPGGGYAQFCVAPAHHALPIPSGLSLAQAAGLPENWYTVWANLIDMAGLHAGDWVLIHGGSSGIGLAATQLARHIGAQAIVTVTVTPVNQPPANGTPSRGATALATHRRPARSTNQVWEPMPPLWTVTWAPSRCQLRSSDEDSTDSVTTD